MMYSSCLHTINFFIKRAEEYLKQIQSLLLKPLESNASRGLVALFYDLCKHGKWHKIQNGNRAGKSQGGLLPIIAY